jgi:hypothetical protein
MYLFVVPVQSTTRSSKQIKIPSTTTSITTIPSRSVNKQSNKSPPLSLASSENLNPANIHRADTKSNRSNPPIVVVPSERSRVRNSGIARNQGSNRRAVPRGSPDPARRRRGRLRRRAEGSGGGGETQPRGGVAVNKEEKKFRAVCPSGEGGQEEAGTAIYNENRQAEEVRSRERSGGPGGPPARSDQDLNAFPIRPGPRVSGTRRVRRRGRRGNDTWWTGGTTQGHNGGRDFFFVVGNVREIFCHSCRLLGKNLSLCPGPAHWPYTAWNKRKTFSSVHGPASSHYVPLQAGPVQQLPTRQA